MWEYRLFVLSQHIQAVLLADCLTGELVTDRGLNNWCLDQQLANHLYWSWAIDYVNKGQNKWPVIDFDAAAWNWDSVRETLCPHWLLEVHWRQQENKTWADIDVMQSFNHEQWDLNLSAISDMWQSWWQWWTGLETSPWPPDNRLSLGKNVFLQNPPCDCFGRHEITVITDSLHADLPANTRQSKSCGPELHPACFKRHNFYFDGKQSLFPLCVALFKGGFWQSTLFVTTSDLQEQLAKQSGKLIFPSWLLFISHPIWWTTPERCVHDIRWKTIKSQLPVNLCEEIGPSAAGGAPEVFLSKRNTVCLN